jgi:uncharacterized protein (DUF2384 family)
VTEAGKPRSAWPTRRQSRSSPLSPEQAKRQGEIAAYAIKRLGSANEAMRFLNEMNPALAGRPLDLAIASAGGFVAVQTYIANLVEKDSLR